MDTKNIDNIDREQDKDKADGKKIAAAILGGVLAVGLIIGGTWYYLNTPQKEESGITEALETADSMKQVDCF